MNGIAEHSERISPESLESGPDEVVAFAEISRQRRLLLVRRADGGVALVTVAVDDGRVARVLGAQYVKRAGYADLERALAKARPILFP
jgi:hypothetical protein